MSLPFTDEQLAGAIAKAINVRVPPKSPTGDHGVFERAMALDTDMADGKVFPPAEQRALVWLAAQCLALVQEPR